jgi:hypothetical protein
LGVIYAIILQQAELKLQRSELTLTRSELAGQKAQMQIQNETLQRQAFENTFFQLLRLHSEIVASMETSGVNASGESFQSNGQECFTDFYQKITGNLSPARSRYSSDGGAAVTEPVNINERYLTAYAEIEQHIGHYFRNLYNIVKFIDESDIKNKQLYINLLRARLSTNEVKVLFYNCLSEMGISKFKPLVERYALLKAISKSDRINPDHYHLYDKSAFGLTPTATSRLAAR